jgi:hypothetical protein
MYEAVTDRRPGDMQRIIKWALKKYRQTGGWLQP